MATVYQRITIVRTSKPLKHNLNEQLQWFGISLGLFGLRDKDKSRFRIFIELLKMAKHEGSMSSDELAEKLGITRGTVVHHLRQLIEMGIVTEDRNRYALRVAGLEQLITEIEKDMQRTCDDLREMAKEIDSLLYR